MIFIESTIFTKLLHNYLDDKELSEFQQYLGVNPKAGDVIPGTGGLRKVRWKGSGKGKRGGTRIIYYWQMVKDRILLMTIYAKNEVSDLTTQEKKLLKEMVARWDDGQ
ncbi:MAG: type II toxin-antitoxin system RelE/ParE family toxin [Magnetococcales bacterium]|nr:type II toxin-antitoxin system RelE/ParE family toxin [Magnetococcales bacterium]